MSNNLWHTNHPREFWQCRYPFDEECWLQAVKNALPLLNIDFETDDIDDLLKMTLGEGQFGGKQWNLSPFKKFYYLIKPLVPRTLTRLTRKWYSDPGRQNFKLDWPIEARYVQFQWEVIRQVILLTNRDNLLIKQFWPGNSKFALVLTHDVETSAGQAYVRKIADLEQSLGFRSSFNFVPERYPLDYELISELKSRGFEIGVHGLKHDGKLYLSREIFDSRCIKINEYLKKLDAVGFRSPLTHRNPEWMQALEIEYDLSFFDTDPYEPLPGGSMSIWPYFIGRFVELPYTLAQDYTLQILGEKKPDNWLTKLDFIEQYSGMALINTHPDYLLNETLRNMYINFLHRVNDKHFYHGLPREVARWWSARSGISTNDREKTVFGWNRVSLIDGKIVITQSN